MERKYTRTVSINTRIVVYHERSLVKPTSLFTIVRPEKLLFIKNRFLKKNRVKPEYPSTAKLKTEKSWLSLTGWQFAANALYYFSIPRNACCRQTITIARTNSIYEKDFFMSIYFTSVGKI